MGEGRDAISPFPVMAYMVLLVLGWSRDEVSRCPIPYVKLGPLRGFTLDLILHNNNAHTFKEIIVSLFRGGRTDRGGSDLKNNAIYSAVYYGRNGSIYVPYFD